MAEGSRSPSALQNRPAALQFAYIGGFFLGLFLRGGAGGWILFLNLGEKFLI